MKITKVEVFRLPTANSKANSPIGCRVYTDTGLRGDGEAGMAYGVGGSAAFGMVCDLAQLVIGMDPLQTELIWETMYKKTFWGQNGGPVVFSGIAAIDVALWDIKGKYFNVPVYQLLGGKVRDKLRTYASQLQFGWGKKIETNDSLTLLYDPQDYYDVVKDAVSEGYDAVKIDPVFAPCEPKPFGEVFSTQGNQIRGCYREHDLKRSVERIAAAREAGGPDMDIIVEIHSLLDANTAAILGKALEPYRIMYYEEPTMPCNPSVFKHIKQRCSLPLATGERSYTRWGFRQFFEDRTLDVIQPDLCNTGGITETKKICDMAQVYDVGVQIHVCGGPIATAAALQVETVIPNFVIHEEHNANLLTKFKNAGKYYYAPKNGFYEVPELPGIGQEMSEQEMATSRKVVIE